MDSESDDGQHRPDPMLRLVWRNRLGEQSGVRGPKKKWSVDEVVDTAIDFADDEGIDGLSMRRIAGKLNTSAASLYTYIPGRDELLGLMVDQAMGRTVLPEITSPATVRERLRMVSQLTWEETHRHPWLITAQRHRPLIGPNISERYEWQLSAIEGCGLDDVAMDHTVALIVHHAVASAAASINAAEQARTSGYSDADWWQVNGPVLAEVMPDGDFPVSGRVGTTVGETYQAVTDPAAVYEYGLEVILDGVVARLDS